MEIAKSKTQFQALIDCALELDGSYYLTYHRWARMDQLETAYPQLRRSWTSRAATTPLASLTATGTATTGICSSEQSAGV